MKKILFAAAVVCTLTSCNGTSIEGSWTEPVPGMTDMQQGFTLEEGGKASSINMSTLQYEKWERHGDMLILQGTSIGNGQTINFTDTLTGQTINFTDTLTIEKLTKDSLVLKDGERRAAYGRTQKM